MSTNRPRALLQLEYEKAAAQYLKSLPLEHFMEARDQATQREITLESLALVRARRPDVQVFNEMLVQCPAKEKGRKLVQVVPDNMVVIWKDQLRAGGSFNVPLQPTGPFWVLEYVTKQSERKDYDDNLQKYEKELKVPYYLLFFPDNKELTLYRHSGRKYHTVLPGENGRVAIPQLDMEMALLDGWVRFWYQGELLPLPGELQRQLDATRQQLLEAQRQADQEREKNRELQRELERLRAPRWDCLPKARPTLRNPDGVPGRHRHLVNLP